ncbi:MAG: hypothetical protein ABIA02_00875 [Candidatus Falkowbacteria bacterium]
MIEINPFTITFDKNMYENQLNVDTELANSLKGKILLQVESNGEAYYIYPDDNKKYYLGRPADAFRIMRELGLGITNSDLSKIPEGNLPN